jgi:hypothetical protein
MTPDEFRTVALSFPETEERSHMNHPDFRVRGKIFATLTYPDTAWAMVKLSPEQQQNYLTAAPEVFEPAAGAWGRGGATMVRLKPAKKTLVKKAIETAWGQVREGKKRKTPSTLRNETQHLKVRRP